MKNKVIGIEISLKHTTYAAIDVRGNILMSEGFSTTDYPNMNDFISVLCERVVTMMMNNDLLESVRSVGISVKSGNFLTGCIENAVNLPWKGVIPLAAMLRDRLGLAVALGSTTQVRGLSEHVFGAAHGMKNFIVVTLGHGMGTSLFSNGQIHLGIDGFAGEMGHSCLVHNGWQCGCGKKGCVEAYVAEKGVIRTATELLAESSEPSLMRQADAITPELVTECCEKGDALAIETYRRVGYMLGLGIANYASIINPEAVIFTGGISKAGNFLFDPALESFNSHVFHNMEGKVPFIVSTLEETERDLLGASVLAWDVEEYSLFK